MWSEQRGTKYRFFERYTDPVTGKSKRVSVTLDRNTPQSARKAAALLRQRIDNALSTSSQPQSVTLKTLTDKYAAHQQATLKPSSVLNGGFLAQAVLRILGEDVLVDRLTAGYVTTKLLETKDPVTATNARINYLRALIRWAYRSDLIDSPALADKLRTIPDKSPKTKLQDKYMEPDELAAVLAAIRFPYWRNLTEFLCLSGLRIGEAIALNDCDVDDRYIHVSKTYSITTRQVMDTPKTEASNRDVYIQPELADCVKRIRSYRRHTLIANGKTTPAFFVDPSGERIKYEAYLVQLRNASQKAIGRKLTPHACRHTMTSIFAAQGAGIDTISRRLGHSNSDVTKEIYLHVTSRMRQTDEDKIDRISVLGGGKTGGKVGAV